MEDGMRSELFEGTAAPRAVVPTPVDAALLLQMLADADYRILRRLDLPTGHTGMGSKDAPFIGLALDVETTGIDHEGDSVIELALRRFRYDHHGVIVAIDRSYAWLEDPGRPIAADIAKLTGLTDADLVGQNIDDEAAGPRFPPSRRSACRTASCSSRIR